MFFKNRFNLKKKSSEQKQVGVTPLDLAKILSEASRTSGGKNTNDSSAIVLDLVHAEEYLYVHVADGVCSAGEAEWSPTASFFQLIITGEPMLVKTPGRESSGRHFMVGNLSLYERDLSLSYGWPVRVHTAENVVGESTTIFDTLRQDNFISAMDNTLTEGDPFSRRYAKAMAQHGVSAERSHIDLCGRALSADFHYVCFVRYLSWADPSTWFTAGVSLTRRRGHVSLLWHPNVTTSGPQGTTATVGGLPDPKAWTAMWFDGWEVLNQDAFDVGTLRAWLQSPNLDRLRLVQLAQVFGQAACTVFTVKQQAETKARRLLSDVVKHT